MSAFSIVPSHGSGAHNWATAFLVIFALSGLGTGGSKHFANTAVFWKYWGHKSIIQVWIAGAIGAPFSFLEACAERWTIVQFDIEVFLQVIFLTIGQSEILRVQ